MRRYALGHALSLEDIMYGFPNDKMNISAKKCKEICKDTHKSYLAGKIWKECVKLVVEDIVDNNVTFQLPIKRKAYLKVKGYDGDTFVKGVQKGMWKDVDYLASDFTGYRMVYEYQKGKTMIDKDVYLNKRLNDKITKRTNEGKAYY